MDTSTALVVGSTGIAGTALTERLVASGWHVLGLSRSERERAGVTPVRVDLRDGAALDAALRRAPARLVFFTAWIKGQDEAENILANGGFVRDVLRSLNESPVEHAALVTGLKHYLGPFEAYGTGEVRDTPFHEDEPRLATPNFYYAQEDELVAAASAQGFTWSVHRAHTMVGFVQGNAMNMALTLGIAAALCTYAERPLYFPGSAAQWNGLSDVTDVELLAEHLIWAATHDEAANLPFNVVNGDVFRWRWLWPRIAEALGVRTEPFDGTVRTLTDQMAKVEHLWPELVTTHGLSAGNLHRLASWWHTDSDLGRPMECLTDMANSRSRGFLAARPTLDSFSRAFARYRQANILPGNPNAFGYMT